jgi:uncharacterized membrane protein
MSYAHGDGSIASGIVGCLSTIFFGKIFGLFSLADITAATVLGAAGAIGGYFAKKLLDKLYKKLTKK